MASPTTRLAALLILSLAAPGCIGPRPSTLGGNPELAERIGETRNAEMMRYRTEKARLEEQSAAPRVIEYDGLGSIIVRSVELRGGPDRAYLRARFTYVNDSGRTLPVPTIRLVFIDREGRRAAAAERTLSRTLNDTIPNDVAHTAWVDLDIGELYLRPGWDWTIELAMADPDR